MGVKEVDRKQRSVPTGDQLRLAKLAATDGGVMDEDQELMKRLIKEVSEATLCSNTRAEWALIDNEYDVDAAVNQIIDNPDLVWTEQKNRKDKKKEDEIAKPTRGQSSTRGRKAWPDKANGNRGKWNQGGLNAPSTTTRGPSRGAAQNGRGSGRVNASSRPQRDNKDAKAGPTENGDHDENPDWMNGPREFKRTEESAATVTDSAPSIPLTNGSSSTGPDRISFAAVAAAGANKERQRQQQKCVPVEEESKPSVSAEDVPRSNQPVEVEPEPSVNTCNPVEEEPLDISQPTSTTTIDLEKKLKADLGIGATVMESFGPPEVANPVEFVSDAATSFSALQEYQFGYNSEPVVAESVMPLSPANQSTPAVQIPEPALFATRSPIVPSSSQAIPLKTEVTLPSQNGEFSNLKSSPPNVPVSSYAQQMPQPRALSYDTSSVSYAPPDSRTTLAKPQPPPTTQPMHVQNPPPTHQQPQQMPYGAPQMPYGSYPYMNSVNMYSPLRNEEAGFAAAALMQYPFGMSGQIDLSQLLPQGALSAGQSQQLPQPQHRNDNPQMMDLKFQSGVNTARDSAVGPPPGFANPNAGYIPPHPQQNLQSLFLQQQYGGPSGPFPYMMQPTVNAARPMYGAAGDDDRKNFERNAAKQGGAQQTPPPHYQQHNGYMQGLGKPKPQQNYGQHNGWN